MNIVLRMSLVLGIAVSALLLTPASNVAEAQFGTNPVCTGRTNVLQWYVNEPRGTVYRFQTTYPVRNIYMRTDATSYGFSSWTWAPIAGTRGNVYEIVLSQQQSRFMFYFEIDDGCSTRFKTFIGNGGGF